MIPHEYPGVVHPRGRPWLSMVVIAPVVFLAMVDNTALNVALPAIQESLSASVTELEWAVNAYVLTFAALMLASGKLADRWGSRAVFTAGACVFTAGSVACGLAPTAGALIVAGALQGIGAALLLPASLALSRHRAAAGGSHRGVTIWAVAAAVGLAVGPAVGGFLTDYAGWRWIFFINVPICGLCAVGAARFLADAPRASGGRGLDLTALATSSFALFALMYALIGASTEGLSSTRTLVAVGLSAIAGVVFLVGQRRRRSLLDLDLFRIPAFVGATQAALLVSFAMFGVLFFMSLFLQDVLGRSAVIAGASFLPMTLSIVLVAPLAARLRPRYGTTWPIAGGTALVGAGIGLLSTLDQHSRPLSAVPGLVLAGIGIGLANEPITRVVLEIVAPELTMMASSILNTVRQIGGALGIAVMGVIVQRQLDGTAAGAIAFKKGFADGLAVALQITAALLCASAITALLLLRNHRSHRLPSGGPTRDAQRQWLPD